MKTMLMILTLVAAQAAMAKCPKNQSQAGIKAPTAAKLVVAANVKAGTTRAGNR